MRDVNVCRAKVSVESTEDQAQSNGEDDEGPSPKRAKDFFLV